jgi:CRISPR/Cas system CSM-associated protein Csm3 (group 7 of RAMP superfamily)
MTKVVYEFSATLEVLTPLHLGSGHFGDRRAVEGRSEGGNDRPEVASIVRDAAGRPYLPATSLKGVLRRLAEAASAGGAIVDVEGLFGVSSDGDETTSRIGAVLLRGAVLKHAAAIPDAPFVGKDVTGELGAGVFIAARTAIDGDLGIAKDGLLFFQEMVAPGSLFTFRAVVERIGSDAAVRAEKAAVAFAEILKMTSVPEGVALGKGQADGFGRVRLKDGSVTIRRRTIGPTGDFVAADAKAIWTEAGRRDLGLARPLPVRRKAYRLVCRGPFIVIDASRRAKRGAREEGDKTPQVRPQRLAADRPLVMGTSVSGALRARARWLAALMGLPPEEDGAEGIPETPVARLFGTTGFRGLLSIDALTVERADTAAVTSVNLDRFSGAPVDNKLFSTEVFTGVKLGLTLSLGKRGRNEPSADDLVLFDRLCAEIEADGLQLGHGGNKGFGWFRAEEVRDGRQ